MNLLTATSAQASASGAAFAVRAGQTAAASFTHTTKAMGVSSIRANGGFVCKRGERDSWTNMGSCGSAEVVLG